MTGSRCCLHLSKVEEFKAWAIANGYNEEKPKGEYEILRLRKGTNPPILIFKRLRGDHASTDRKSQKVVNEWMNSKKDTISQKDTICQDDIYTLAQYNAEVARGLIHTGTWKSKMEDLQKKYELF